MLTDERPMSGFPPSAAGTTALEAGNFLHRSFEPALAKAAITGFRWHGISGTRSRAAS
jgi:hypothetical protein